ncbi:hypothetical protein [Frondihabitans peucedani]
MARTAIVGQPDVTNSTDVAELTVLKRNLVSLIQSGAQSVDRIFSPRLDIDALASKTRSNVHGGITIDLRAAVEELAKPLHDLLKGAGYQTEPLKRHGGDYSYDRFTASDMEITPYPEVSAFERAVEKLGHARLAQAARELATESEKAAGLWDSL